MMLNRSLSVFICAAECGSVTRAAKLLYITQPAVSNAIAKLEEELGVRLFSRDRRSGLLLTDAGEKIFALAKQMEDAGNRIYQTAYSEKKLLGGRLRIAALSLLVSTIVAGALREYRTLYPGVEVEIKEGTPNDIFAMVESRAADFALSCAPFGRFHALTLRRDKMAAILPPGRVHDGAVNLAEPPDLLIVNKPAYETLMEYTAAAKIKFGKMLLVQNAETAIRMAEEGVGIGIVSEYTLETLAPEAVRYPVVPEISFEIGMFANDMEDLPPAAAEMARIIKEKFHGGSARI